MGWNESTHFTQTLSFPLVLYLSIFNTNGTKVISDCLNTAIKNAIAAIIIPGIAATSAHTVGTNDLNTEYAIAHHIIIIVSCLRLSPNIIGSSFSI
jgi:hypothetical protein